MSEATDEMKLKESNKNAQCVCIGLRHNHILGHNKVFKFMITSMAEEITAATIDDIVIIVVVGVAIDPVSHKFTF